MWITDYGGEALGLFWGPAADDHQEEGPERDDSGDV
jgi:hypothetical protein